MDATRVIVRAAGVLYAAAWTFGLYWLWFGFRAPHFLWGGDRKLHWGWGGFSDLVRNTIPNPYRGWVFDQQTLLLVILSILAMTAANIIWKNTLGRLDPGEGH